MRIISRLLARGRLALCQHELSRAETTLGLLGWQQADFDADTSRQVNEIQEVERAQTDYTNRAAELGSEVRRLRAEHEAAKREFEEKRRQVEAERRRIREPREGIEKQLAEKRKIEPNFERRIPELDRELRDVQKLYSELLVVEPQTPQSRQELSRLRERTVSIPNEKTDLRTQHLRTVTEIRALEEQLEREQHLLTENEAAMRKMDREWAEKDRDFDQQVRALERERGKVEKQINDLESAKVNPYRRIGQVLADSNIGPLNQPEALDKVRRLRFRIGELRQEMLELQQESDGMSAQTRQYGLFLLVGGVVFVFFLAALIVLA